MIWFRWVIILWFIVLAMFVHGAQGKKWSLSARTIFSTLLGTGFGLLVHHYGTKYGLNSQYFLLPGYIFQSLIRLLVIPLIFIATTYRVVHKETMGESDWIFFICKNQRVLMLVLAAVIGVVFGKMLDNTGLEGFFIEKAPKSFLFGLANCVVYSYLLAYLLGKSILKLKDTQEEKADLLIRGVDACCYVMEQMIVLLMGYKPLAVFCLISGLLIEDGFYVVLSAVFFIVLIYSAVFLLFGIQLVIALLHGVHPFRFLKFVFPVMVMAIKTRSSANCMGLMQEILEEDFKIPKSIAYDTTRDTIQRGMQGCMALFPVMATCFVLLSNQIPISLLIGIVLIVVVLIVGNGVSGMSGVATMSTFGTTMAMGGEIQSLGVLLAIDPVVDIARTFINVTGAMVNAMVVNRWRLKRNHQGLEEYDDPEVKS